MGEEDEGFLLQTKDNLILTSKKKNIQIGDIIGFGNNTLKFDKDIFNKEFLDNIEKKRISYNIAYMGLSLSNLKKKNITKELLIDLIDKQVRKEKEETGQLNEEEEREKLDEENRKKTLAYEEESVGDFQGYNVDKKVIIDNTQYNKKIKIVLKGNVSKYFDFNWFDNNPYDYKTTPTLISYLLSKKIPFTCFQKKDTNRWRELYELDYDDGKVRINKVKIPKNKVEFIINRIKEKITKEQIKLLCKLTGMKIDLLNTTKISFPFSETDFDIRFSFVNENSFDVEFFDKKKRLNWGVLRDFFFQMGESIKINRDFDKEKLLKFTDIMGIEKKDLFKYLRKIKLLMNLK